MKTPRNVYHPHKRVQSIPTGPSRTKQAFAKETDINHILRQAEKGLLVTHVNAHQGQYGDFTTAPDYHSALNQIKDAQDMFSSIPADIRAQFHNDPAEFLDFAQNPENLAEMRDMGLAPPDRSTAVKLDGDPATPPADPPVAPAPAPPAS